MRSYWELCKPKISGLSAFSAAVGFIFAAGGIRPGAALTIAGVFLLACGACSLNQYQERRTDSLMTRTKGRPLPSGRIRPLNALLFSLSLLAAAFVILHVSAESTVPMLLGLIALLWYNGIYTFLKRKIVFAAVPGAVVGALPPAIGWSAAGGLLADSRLAFLCFFFFMWQTPHFWLLLLDRGAEYEAAGLPSLTRKLRMAQLLRVVFVWTAAAAVSVLLVGMAGMVRTPAINIALCVSAFWLIWKGAELLFRGKPDYSFAFKRMNIFALVVMVLLSVDGLLRNVPLYH